MTRRFFPLLCAIFIAGSALAQDPAPARFFIERIEVRGTHRVSSALVISETLLREGQEYSEADLSAASARLSRQPYLLSVDFALEKGSDRGRHVLVINVVETKPFFFLLDVRPTLWDESRRGDDYELDPDPSGEAKDAALGFRWFVGGRGIVHVGLVSRNDRQAFTSDYNATAIGYTQYGLFGTAAFVTVNLRMPFESPSEHLLSPQLVVGVPLTKNQTVTFDFEDTHFRNDTITIFNRTFKRQESERLFSLAWTYNTTNQPFVPTRGTVVRIAPLWSMTDRSSYAFVAPLPGGVPEAYVNHLNGFGLDAVVTRYWELSERNAVSAGVLAGWAEVADRYDPAFFRPAEVRWKPAYEVLRGGYSRNLWRGDSKSGDSRLEFDGRVILRQRNVETGRIVFGTTPDTTSSFETSVSWARRSSWGMLRLGVGYAWQR
jgi:hypothetical protein